MSCSDKNTWRVTLDSQGKRIAVEVQTATKRAAAHAARHKNGDLAAKVVEVAVVIPDYGSSS